MTIGTRLYTLINGKKVGSDTFGNVYYTHTTKKGKEKRWVIYKGKAEASKVPSHWHGWLHYTCELPLPEQDHAKSWIKQHQPNHTGTKQAYQPKGHVFKGGKRAPATGDYEAWQPDGQIK